MISSDNGLNLNFAHLEASGSIILWKKNDNHIMYEVNVFYPWKPLTRTKGKGL